MQAFSVTQKKDFAHWCLY